MLLYLSKLSEDDRKYVIQLKAEADGSIPAVNKDSNDTDRDDEGDVRRVALKYYAAMRASDIEALKPLLVVFPINGSRSRPLAPWPVYPSAAMSADDSKRRRIVPGDYKIKVRIRKAKIEGDEATVPVVSIVFGLLRWPKIDGYRTG